MLKHWKWFVAVALVFHLALAFWGFRRAHASTAVNTTSAASRSGVPAEALAPARSARERIESAEKRMVDEDRALAQALYGMEAGRFNPKEQRVTVQALRVYVQALRGAASDLLSHHREYVEAERQYRESLGAAPAIFRDASRLFHEYAAGEPYLELKREYEKLASDWLTLAALVSDRAAAAERDRRTYDLSDTLRYVERTALFLDRLDAHLESFPVAQDPGPLRDRTLAELKAYIDGFEALRKHLGIYREKLRGGAVSPDVRRDLTAAKARPAAGSQVSAAVPSPSPAVNEPAPKPETYACFCGSTSADGTYISVAADRDFAPGEAYRVEVDRLEHATAIVVRTTHRKNGMTVVQFEVTRPFPKGPVGVFLIRTNAAPPSAAGPASVARR